MKRILLLFLVGFLFTGCFKKSAKNTDLDKVNLKEKVQTAPKKEQLTTELFPEVKKDSLESNSTKIDYKIIQRADYKFAYCEEFELPYFVKYTVNKKDVFGLGNRDKSRWKSDALVDTKTGANSDYIRSGYDRGHLKPAAVSKTTQEHMNQSHLFSNCSPQLPAFNRGGWRSIEGTVRHIVGDGIQDSVIVYTGPILNNITEYIGKENKIGIPKYHYKTVLYGDSTKAYAYLCPNEKLIKPYSKYIVSIDSIESLIGIDLYEGLDESLEK